VLSLNWTRFIVGFLFSPTYYITFKIFSASSYVPANDILQNYNPPSSVAQPFDPIAIQTSYQPVISTYQPSPTIVTPYEPVQNYIPESVPNTYQPIVSYEPQPQELLSYQPLSKPFEFQH